MDITKNIEEQELDSLIMDEIIHDVISGALLTQADDKTLDMMLTHIWEMKESFKRVGVIIGDA